MAAVTCRDSEEAHRWRDLAQGHQDVAERFERLNQLVRGDAAAYRDAPSAYQPRQV